MQRLGLSLLAVKAIFVSHEHSDHISGLAQLSGKYQIPVYITAQTLRSTRLLPARFPLRVLTTYEPVEVGELRVTAFPKQHDAVDPHSFLIEGQETKVGVFTDIGTACDHVVRHFSQCHAVFLEANYDEDLLANGRYPAFLKQRIRGDQGHLSNQQALALLKAHKPPFMSHVLLAHLSKDNNSPVVARDLFLPHMENTELIVASRFAETPIYTVQAN